MYRIIGGDQQEYGPTTDEEIKRWIREGRADAETLAQREGQTEWSPLRELPEFAESLGLSRAEGPPEAEGAGRGTIVNGMAIAGLVMAILGLVCCGPLFSMLGLIFAGVGWTQINRAPTRYTGKRLAVAAIVIAAAGLILFLILLLTGTMSEWMRQLEEIQRELQ